MLDDLDKELERRGHRFCRYADDCNIYVRSLAAEERVMASVTRFLESRLRLRVNQQKSAVAPVGERKFLGYRLGADGTLDINRREAIVFLVNAAASQVLINGGWRPPVEDLLSRLGAVMDVSRVLLMQN